MAYDAVIVLGGGVRQHGELPGWVETRFELAVERAGESPILCLSAGTVHRPNPLDDSGCPIFESVAGARFLLRHGIPARRIFIEAASWDTVGNAYFARTIHCEPAGWRRLLVITSEAHMPRAEAIFRWVFGLAPDAGYALEFASSADEGLTSELLAARRSHEAASLAMMRQVFRRVRSLAGLHRWMFTEHRAYMALMAPPPPVEGIVTEMY